MYSLVDKSVHNSLSVHNSFIANPGVPRGGEGKGALSPRPQL